MLLHLFLLFGSSAAVIVDTKYGKVKGYPYLSMSGRHTWLFSGIRYATPPLGYLRFKDPLPPQPYDGVRDVTANTACLTAITLPPEVPIGEDCLQLAVYTPSLNSTETYPVVVWMHDGSWSKGTGQALFPGRYYMDHDLVVVVPEYRMGIFGFLTLENNVMPGNMQLKDQVLVLKWIQENIAAFKGDPGRVVLKGQTTGAAAVQLHMKSPMSQGLFQSAVSESGSSTASWSLAVPGQARSFAINVVAKEFHCSSDDDTEILICLQQVDANDFLMINTLFQIFPVLDWYSPNSFIPVNPHQAPSAPVPVFAGVCNLDGYLFSKLVNHRIPYFGWEYDFDGDVTALFLMYSHSSKKAKVTRLIKKRYLADRPITKQLFANITDVCGQMFSDRQIFFPLLLFLNNHPGPAYIYVNSYNYRGTYKGGLNGSTYDDLNHLIWLHKVYNPIERNLSKQLTKVFVDFMTYGTPTPQGSSDFQWPLWNRETQPLVTIDTYGNIREDHGFFPERMQFWEELHNFAPDIDKY